MNQSIAQYRYHRQAGLTLVELMIALALSGILLSGLFKVIEANKSTLVLTESFINAQESGRFSLELLSRDIRMAGYSGCVNDPSKVVSILDVADPDYSAEKYQFSNAVTVIDDYDSGVHPASFGGVTPLAGSDVFMTSGAVPTDLFVAKTPAASSVNMEVIGPQNQMDLLVPGAVLLVTDCSDASVFSVSGVTAGTSNTIFHKADDVDGFPDNSTNSLGVAYESGSSVLFMTNAVYFIAPSTVSDTNSLYRFSSVEGGGAVELMPFIEDLVFSYGVDVNNDHYADRYVTGDELNNLAYQLAYDAAYQDTYNKQIAAGETEAVAIAAAEAAGDVAGDAAAASSVVGDFMVSVRIEVVTQSQDNVKATALAGYPDDGKLRKRFTRVVQVRNSGIGNDG